MTSSNSNEVAKAIVDELKAKGSKDVVMADGNKEAFELCFAINQILASQAVSKDKVNLVKEGNNTNFDQFLKDANDGNVGVMFTFTENLMCYYQIPCHTYDAIWKNDV